MKWLTIESFPNYEVSDTGLVRRIDTKKELAQNTKKGKHPYKRVHLSHEGVAKYVLVHRLVLFAFVGECPEGQQCLHADDDPSNNHLSNLCWGTPKKNHETIDRSGENNGRAKLTKEDVSFIRSSNQLHTVLAAQFNVAAGYISQIQRGKTWRFIPQN
jgi:hypothetical protein